MDRAMGDGAMSVIRVNKNTGYFVASNEPFNDERLSWEARGVMGYLLSKPDGWQIKEQDLINKGPAGRDKIRRVIRELKEAGYVRMIEERLPDGTFTYRSEVYESPSLQEAAQQTDNGLSVDGSTVDGSSDDGKPVSIVNTKRPNTKREKTKGGGSRSGKRKTTAVQPAFEGMEPPPEPEPDKSQQAYFGQVCSLLGYKTSLMTEKDRHVVVGLVKRLREADLEPGELDAFRTWYWDDNWRRERQIFPNPSNLLTWIGKWKAAGELAPGADEEIVSTSGMSFLNV